jgi:transcriptional regulator with XRE-family HTH domain
VSTDPTGFGEFVRYWREANGLSIRAAAGAAGISEGRWRQVEKGYQSVGGGLRVPVKPSERLVEAIADALTLERAETLEIAGYPEAAERWRRRAARGEPSVTEENPRPEGEIDRGSVGSRQQDAEYVAHRHPDDPPVGGLSDEEVLALIRENRRLADELERRIRGGSAGPVDGAT